MRCRSYLGSVVSLCLLLLLLACGGADSNQADGAGAPEADAGDAAVPGGGDEGTVEGTEAAGAEAGVPAGLANPNLASADELQEAGLSAEAAAAVVAGRPYLRASDLHAVLAGQLDDEGARAVYDRLWLPIDLNSASREEIMLIPGVGERMAYEFEEYRPYTDIEQFRREIGKYVDEDEVARLERYVTIN